MKMLTERNIRRLIRCVLQEYNFNYNNKNDLLSEIELIENFLNSDPTTITAKEHAETFEALGFVVNYSNAVKENEDDFLTSVIDTFDISTTHEEDVEQALNILDIIKQRISRL